MGSRFVPADTSASPRRRCPRHWMFLAAFSIAVQHQPAGRANVRAHAQALGHARPAATTVLTGVGGWHGDNPTPGACCLGFEDGPEPRPAGIADALGEAAVPQQVGDLQVFQIDRVVGAQQRQRRLVVEVGPLSPDRLVRASEARDGLAPSVAAPLAARDAALRLCQLLLPPPVVAGILDDPGVRRDEEDLQPHVDARLLAGRWQRPCGHLGTGKRDIPAIRLFAERDRLGRALQGAGPAHRDASELGEDEEPVIEAGTVAILLVGERVVAAAPLEAREARLLAVRQAPEERLIRLVQPRQHVLQDVRVDCGVFRELGADHLQLRLLLIARDGDVAALPGGDALLKRGVVERATAPEHLV